VTISSTAKETANGDRCQYFTGTGCKYYVLLCDGMGTGLGAAQEGQTALTMLRQMLTAGFPAEYALRSINSLCCLRGRAGAVTVDLLELRLDSGKASIYKWGAAASYLLRDGTAEKIGTVGPPPGISVTDIRETVDRLSLRRGEALILCSDGVDGEGVLRRRRIVPGEPPGELAAELLEKGTAEGADDATVAVIRLHPTNLST
jgi:stage II sporulation protein E